GELLDRVRLEGPQNGGVMSVSPDGRSLLFFTQNSFVSLSLRTGRHRGDPPSSTSGIDALGWAAGGRTVVAETYDDWQEWEASTGRPLGYAPITDHESSSRHFAVWARSPDGRVKAFAEGPSLSLYDPRRGKVLRELRGHTQDVTVLGFSPDGRLLASLDKSG